MKNKVVICVIGTGKYLDYFPKYYENIEKYFLPDSEKTILLFTDGKLNHIPDNVKVYDQEHLPLPYRNLKKFEIIKKDDWPYSKCYNTKYTQLLRWNDLNFLDEKIVDLVKKTKEDCETRYINEIVFSNIFDKKIL